MARPKANEKVEKGFWRRTVESRTYRFRDDERMVASMAADGEEGGWEIWEYAGWSRDQWVSLKVFDARAGVERTAKRRVYQVGYSMAQRRMARNVQIAALDDLYPDVGQWVRKTIAAMFGKDGD